MHTELGRSQVEVQRYTLSSDAGEELGEELAKSLAEEKAEDKDDEEDESYPRTAPIKSNSLTTLTWQVGKTTNPTLKPTIFIRVFPGGVLPKWLEHFLGDIPCSLIATTHVFCIYIVKAVGPRLLVVLSLME